MIDDVTNFSEQFGDLVSVRKAYASLLIKLIGNCKIKKWLFYNANKV